MAKDYLHTEESDLMIRNGDFAVGESTLQEVGIVLRLNPGELKSDPVLGPGLIRFIKSNAGDAVIRQKARLHLERDGKNYEQLKNQIKFK
jgi:hypothetical protein